MPIFVKSAALAFVLWCSASGAPAADALRGLLDGKIFLSTLHVAEQDRVFEDQMTFDAGLFQSAECQRQCDFGKTAYHAENDGDAIVFRVQTTCKDAPQSVEWEGRVVGDSIEGTAIWKVKRFYWRIERRAVFSGSLAYSSAPQATLTGK